MRNFKLTVKMMVMAIVMGALFCSCNMAGGSEFGESSSKVSEIGTNGNGSESHTASVAFSIIIPEINVSISGADKVTQSKAETTTITAEATEGAVFMWYVNGMLQSGETETTYDLSRVHPGVYEVTCIAVSADGTLAKSASKVVTVTP